MKFISSEQKLEIAVALERYHKVFFVFIEMASITFTESIPTAAVRFHRASKPELLLNEKFWLELSEPEKLFVICHECLHVLLNHGARNGLNVPGATPELVNVAQDITINEMIVELFDFDRSDLPEWKRYCWIDTCFKDPASIKRRETFQYYLEELLKNAVPELPATLDVHPLGDGGSDGSDGSDESRADQKARAQTAQALAGELTVAELEDLLRALPEAGTLSGALELLIVKKAQRTRLKFSHLVRKLKRTSLKEVPVDVETFTHDDRRFSDVMRCADVALPGKVEVLRLKPERLLTAVFMDVSGSCLEYLRIFNEVFLALDAQRETFDTKLFTFDTKVTEVRPGDRIRAGGGTRFSIIETKCLELEARIGKYPDGVIVITDGFGDQVVPKALTKWIWLLTPKNSTTQFIPSRSRKFLITDLEF